MRLLEMKQFRGAIQVSFRYHKHLGPRGEMAGVSLGLGSNDTYRFTSQARWPEDDYTSAVERGVRDGLREAGFDPDLGVSVRLEAVEYHPIDSDERAFYFAAKSAASAWAVDKRRSAA